MTIYSFLELFIVIGIALYANLTLVKEKHHNWIKYYCLVNAILGGIAATLALNKISNLIIIYMLIWIEVYLLSIYFRKVSSNVVKLPEFLSLSIIYSILIIIHLLLESLNSFSPYSRIFEGIIVFCYCTLYFIEQAKTPKEPLIFLNPNFWFVSGFMIYYGGTWLILASSQYFINDKGLFIYLWDLHNIISILKYVSIGIGFYLIKRR